MNKRLLSISTAWKKAGVKLSIRVEAPYELKDAEGQSYYYVAYLPDFGGKKGVLLIGATTPEMMYDPQLVKFAEEQGYYYSILSTETYSEYDENEFIATLDDWGYFGLPGKEPAWYSGKPWGV